jgi:hypothetical protein
MEDAVGVGIGERVGGLDGELEEFVEWIWARSEAGADRGPVDIFEDEKVGAVLFADFVEMADVGVIERRSYFRFLKEALQLLLTGGEGGEQHLDGDLAIEPRVAGEEDFTHAARTEAGYDAIVAESLIRLHRDWLSLASLSA